MGGGFGIRYTESDTPLTLETYVRAVTSAVREQFTVCNYPLPEIWVEPGRSIVGDAGTTLYTVGSVKDIPGIRKYVSVDGGMTDNLRPALYNARYEAMLANRGNDENEETVSIAGKCCERRYVNLGYYFTESCFCRFTSDFLYRGIRVLDGE